MGNQRSNMLRVCLLLLAAFVMSTMSFPEDEVVPETASALSQLSTRHPELKNATPKDAAHAKIKMLQAQGFDNTQCSQMATDAISGMTSTLKAEQDAMDALSTGADCLVATPATRRLLGITTEQQHLDAAAQALVASKADLATKEATHVKCAVDGTADDACSVPAFAATDKPLVTEASSADCAATTSTEPVPAAAPACPADTATWCTGLADPPL